LLALYGARFEAVAFYPGAALCIMGELLRIRSVQFAGGSTRTRQVGAPNLITSGPYAMVRNPLYLANMLLYTGFSLASNAWFPWLPLVAFVYFTFQYTMIVSLEEQTLGEIFGEKYDIYCRRVPRLFPRLGSKYTKQPPANRFGIALREERSTLMGLTLSWIVLLIRLFYVA
jgi:protein-S-isoprenylcysteine O-methyltransferase Ste14